MLESIEPKLASPDAAMTTDAQSCDDAMLRVLNADGQVVGERAPELPDAELLRVHRAMVLTRAFDLRMFKMQRQGQMGTFAPSYGQEATQIGQVYPLTTDDWFCPSYRSFGAQIWRGWTMDRLMLLWAGYFEGFPPPEGVNDLPFSIVIGSQAPVAAGIAMGMQYRGDRFVAMTNFGDGAASEGAVAEALNMAAVNTAPCIFVLENNGYAISTQTMKQTATPHMKVRGEGYGVPSVRVDGNDVLAMIMATTGAAQRARNSEGPTLIEAVTYRMSLHTTADDPTLYRDDAEVEEWKAKCPILRFERFLIERGVLTEESAKVVESECEAEVIAARDRFREHAEANPREVFDFMFAELPPELEEQKAEYLQRLQRRGL